MNVPAWKRNKNVVRVERGSVTCIHQGALIFGGTCFATNADLAHSECAVAAGVRYTELVRALKA